ncbi:retrovirus-related pol polyprotein from transposon TNT 1-94 [Tanacetum coccineum]
MLRWDYDPGSRKVWVYFLKNKSKVFNTFKKWKAAVENETNHRVKCLKSDNGGEYSSREFIEYCAENGIRMLKTVPETPQQNGVAERMNQTLNERAKSLRLHAGLPKMFWEDSVKDVTRDKLDAKSVKCTFIGYGSDEMGYRFWDLKTHKVIQSRDVTFNEDSLYRAKAATDSSNLTKPNQKDQVSPGRSSDTSEGSENSGSFEDNRRSDKEYSKDKASSKEEGSETPQVKEDQDGKKRYKARLVVKGFQEKHGVDYNEIFSPVVKMTTIRLVLSIVAAENLHLEQLDVKTAFLHGHLDEDIYMTQLEGFQSAGQEENLVCKLNKSLYGLKQAPRQWYLKFDNFMQRAGYKRCAIDHCCYLKKVDSYSIILLLYVDDMLVAGFDMAEIKKLKRQLSQEFEMKDLGKVLEKFNMKDAKARCQPLGDHFKLNKKQAPKTEALRRRMAKVPYALAAGSVMYAMVCKRLYIAHVVGAVSRFMSNLGREHWKAVKWLLRYLKGTSKATLYFSRKEVILEGFSDSDYGGCLDSGKSTTGYAGKELVWLKNFLEELDRAQKECVLFCDNQSAIHLAKNLVFHGRTEHIKIRYHYILELVSEGTLSLKKILGAKNRADMLTKVVTTEKLKLCATSTGLRDN